MERWGEIKISIFHGPALLFTSRIPADNDLQPDNDTVTRWNERLCSPRSLRLLGTQAAHAAPRPAAGRPWPGLPDPRRTRLAPSASLVAVWKHFLPPPPSPASRWERVGLPAGSALAVTPTRFPDSPRRGGPRLAPRSRGGTQAPGAERGRSGTPRFGQGKGQLAARRDPAAFPGVTCSLAGVSRSSRPLPALSPHAVAHAGFSAGPPCTRGGGRPAAPRCCPEPRRPRVNDSRSPTSRAPGSPLGSALPDAGFATNFAGQRRGRWPGQGGPRQCPARDQPGWRGGGRGRTPPQLLQDHSELPAGAGPPEPVTHLPNPAPARPRSLPPAWGGRATVASRPRCACDRRHRPSGRVWFSHWLFPGCVPPLGPTQPGARPVARLPGRAAGNYAPSTAPAACPAVTSPPGAAPRPRPRPLGRGR